MHPILPDGGRGFEERTAEAAAEDYDGFGADLLTKLRTEHPLLSDRIRYFRSETFQPEDLYAVCSGEGETPDVAIQWDPQCEVICLWTVEPKQHVEVGTWADDPCGVAITRLIEFRAREWPDGGHVPPAVG
ncbi:MAG: hypothetical protein AAF957_17115 [Planctomycetota bacterium]